MATDTTFNTLQIDIRRYIERGFSQQTDQEVFEQIPRLINLAERIIARELKVEEQKIPLADTLVAGQCVYSKPDGWRQTASFAIATGIGLSTYTPIFPRAYEYVRSYWPNPTATSAPLYYADYDSQQARSWLIGPTPDQNYPFEVIVYLQPPLLDNAVQQNWLTIYAPQLLLFGTLLQCAPFLKNDERIGTWQAMYDRALQVFTGEDLLKILDNSTERTRD